MYVTVNNVEIYYECFGKGKEIIFIPGNGTSFKYMKKLALLLTKKYKVYLIDRRGQGKSTAKCELSYDLNVQDIYNFMQKLYIRKPYIIGHSGGAIVTMMLCINHMDIADKIVLCSGACNLDAVDNKYIKKWKMYSKLKLINPKLINMILNQKDLKDELFKINVETLVLSGKKDIISRENTQTIKNLISKSKLKIYDNENHSSYITNTRCFEDIYKFLSSCEN